jgi:hypothetical protein
MAKVLILINTPNNRAETYLEGLDRHCHYITTDKVGFDDGGTPRLYEVDEKFVDGALTLLTEWNPGMEVVAYKPYRSGIRPAGEMTLKEISKEGILPV